MKKKKKKTRFQLERKISKISQMVQKMYLKQIFYDQQDDESYYSSVAGGMQMKL